MSEEYQLTELQKRELRAALFLIKYWPEKYRFEHYGPKNGKHPMIEERRLIEISSGKELMPWTIIQILGRSLL